MAVGWLTAFKVIPWADVIQATPSIVRGARSIWQSAKKANEEVDRGLTKADSSTNPTPAGLAARLDHLERELAASERRQAAMAELAASLAEQNAALVQAVSVLKTRTLLLLVLNVVLAALIAGWLLFRL